VLVNRRGFDPKGALRKRESEGPSVFTGMHTYDDAFVVWAGHEPNPEPVGVEAVAATALRLLGVDAPDLDGRPLSGAAERVSSD
jgi:hypothetical protein